MDAESYKCKFCKKGFFSERVFMRHECTQMRRSKEIQTTEGRMAYGLYKKWLEKQRRSAPPVETFLTSSYYTSFTRFSEWVRETGVPDPEKYVELMVENQISPANWRRTEAYQIYLQWVDKVSDPYEQAATTAQTIFALAEGLEIPPGDVFKQFTAGEMTELIQQRRLSPWLLFCSSAFRDWTAALNDGDREALMKSIGVQYWAHRLERATAVVVDLRQIAKEMGI